MIQPTQENKKILLRKIATIALNAFGEKKGQRLMNGFCISDKKNCIF